MLRKQIVLNFEISTRQINEFVDTILPSKRELYKYSTSKHEQVELQFNTQRARVKFSNTKSNLCAATFIDASLLQS